MSDETEQPLLYHLIELRDCLLRVVLVIGVVFVALVPFSNTLFSLLSGPLMAHMPDDSSMIAIEVASPFLIPFKLTLFLALFISIPYVLYQIWSFVAPGLYKNERNAFKPYLYATPVLFVAGASLVFFMVMPIAMRFFISFQQTGEDGRAVIELLPKVSEYLSLTMTLILAFGICFQMPVILTLLGRVGIITSQGLKEKRKYLLIGPGRWGSADRWLGIPVSWAEISGVGAMIETASDELRAEPSQGSHFFHNISTLGINYVTVSGDDQEFLDWDWIKSLPVTSETPFVAHAVLDRPFVLKVDGRTSRCVMYMPDDSS